MTDELSPEQVAEYREQAMLCDGLPAHRALALCDTVEHLRGERKLLRGVVDRINDGWQYALPRWPDPEEEHIRGVWWRVQDGEGNYVVSGTRIPEEPMSPAEVQAIYGTEPNSEKENESDGRPPG